MKKHKRRAALLGLLVAAVLLPSAALAAGRIDLTQDVGLTLTCKDGAETLKAVEFSLYHVAAVDETGELTVLAPFDTCGVNLDIRGKNDAAWMAVAVTLEGCVQARNIPAAASGSTDAAGILEFPAVEEGTLAPGLYLVTGLRHAQGGYYYDPAPFMVLLPGHGSEDEWAYQVAAAVKFDRTDVPSEDDDTVDRVVKKVWKDGDSEERPTSVTVQLLRNGEVYETVTLTEAERWRYAWAGLDAHDRWTVAETDVPAGYTVSVTREGAVFTVTNRLREDSEEPAVPDDPVHPDTRSRPDMPTLPQTGQLWWPVPLLLCGGLALICVGLLRKRDADEKT